MLFFTSAGEDSNLLDPTLCQSLADELRGWAVTILAHHQGDVQVEAVERLLTMFICWLDRCAEHLTGEPWSRFAWESIPGRGGYWNKSEKRHGQFGPEFLCSCLVFSFSLKGTSASLPLKRIMQRCFRCAPPEIRGAAERLLSDVQVPSPAILSRSRF